MVTDSPNVVLSLMTCTEGRLVLTQTPYVTDIHALEVVIDKDFIRVRNNNTIDDLKKVPTPDNFIGCDVWRSLWVSWSDELVLVGSGELVGEGELLRYDRNVDELFIVTSFSLSSSGNSAGGATWKVEKRHVQTLFMETSKQNGRENRTLLVTENGHVIFGVRSCNEITLQLTHERDSAFAIDIKLSANGHSTMFQGRTFLASAETRGLLHCHLTRFIWVKWAGHVLDVGKGVRILDGILMSAVTRPGDAGYNTLLIASRYSQATWLMHNFDVNSFKLLADDNPGLKSYRINAQARDHILFRVRACQDAVLEMRRVPSFADNAPGFVRMTIGTQGNVQTDIDWLNASGALVSSDNRATAQVLNCNEMRRLWFSWKDGTYRLGTGGTPMANQLFAIADTFDTPAPHWLHLVSLDINNLIAWQFDQDQGNRLVIPTPMPHSSFVTRASFTVGGTTSLVFKLKGNRDAKMFLGRYLAYAYGDMYEVYIGTLKNDGVYSGITVTGNSDDVIVKTPDVITSNEERYFWVSWYGGHIELGRGSVVGEGTFVSRTDLELYEVNAVHLMGSPGVEWTLNAFQVQRYSIHTNRVGSEDSYKNVWLSTHLHVFPFMVRAPNPVSVVLTRTPGQASDGDIEITFGIDDNTGTSVIVRGDNSTFKRYPGDNLISDTELRPFWFIWYEGTLRVGIGDVWSQNQMFTYTPNGGIYMNGVILNSYTPAPTEWSILPETVNLVWKKTPATYGHRQLWRDVGMQTSIVFKVSASEEAHILLSPAIEETEVDVIEVTIGYDGNGKTIIRNGTTKDNWENILTSVDTPNILHPTEMRTFWASWLNGEIQLGNGNHVGVNAIVDWMMDDPIPIHAVSVCTSTTTGQWEISEVVRDIFHITTFPIEGPAISSFLTVSTGKAFLQFGVVTCNSAWVALFVNIDKNLQIYSVSLGENRTDVAVLYHLAAGDVNLELARSSVPGVIQCGVEEVFWLSWEDQNMIRLGKGNFPNKILLEHPMNAPISIREILFTTGIDGPGSPTQWQLRPDSFERLRYSSVGPTDYRRFWLASSTSQKHIRFTLKTAGPVEILLGAIPQVTTQDFYTVIIRQEGANDRLMMKKNGEMMNEISVPRLLLSDHDIFLWISWHDGIVAIGKGVQIGVQQLLHWKDDDPLDVTFFSVTSIESDQTSYWSFFSSQGSVFEAYTPDTKDLPSSYNRVMFAPLQHLNHVRFQVRACNNARLAISDKAGSFTQGTYEIVFDTDSEYNATYSAIRKGVNGTNVGILRTTGTVSCETVKDFWVSWEKGLQVGKGQIPGDEFLHYSPILWDFEPSAISMATGPGSDGNWMFPVEQAEAVFVNISQGGEVTGKVYDHFWMGVHDRTGVVFSIRAEKHATILLSDVAFQGDNFAYEFEIEREDGCTAIREKVGGTQVACVNKTGLLAKDEYRTFWISWDSNMLRLGKGSAIYINQVIKYNMGDATTSFASLGVASGTDLGGGEWSFLRSSGKVFRVVTPSGEEGISLYIYPHAQVITFQVRACSDASLILFGDPKSLLLKSVVITIGGSLNSKVEFLYLLTGNIVATTTVHNVLDCNALRSFWVTWDNSVIRVGSGRDPHSNTLLSWQFDDIIIGDPAPFNVTFITVEAGATGAEWEMDFYQTMCAGIESTNKCVSNETFVAQTGNSYHYEQHWVAVTGEMSIVFMVRACSDVHLALAAIPSNQRTLSYEVVIGTSSNSKSRIRRKVGAFVSPEVEKTTRHILSCSETRPFWVSWYGNEVVVGTGRQVGLEPFMRWSPEENIHVINSVGISTGGGSEGLFIFGNLDLEFDLGEEHKEDRYIVQTPNTGKYLTSWTPANNYILFSVQACSNALLSVNAIPSHPEMLAFEIAIGTHSNTKTSITLKGNDQRDPVEVDSENILHCNGSRHFWVQWYADTISFGKQNTNVGEQPIVSFYSQEMPEIHSVSVSTSIGSGIWEVPRSVVFTCESMVQPLGPPKFEELLVTTETATEVVFEVKACAEVYLLVGGFEEKNAYFVAIGTNDNSWSSIRNGRNGDVLDETQTSDVLSCGEGRWFWTRWYQGLEVGRGRTPGTSIFLRTTKTNPVQAVAFSTAFGRLGTFRFFDIEDDSFYVSTPADNTYEHVWVSIDNSALTFKVRACTGGLVRLGERFLDPDPNKPAYEVILDNGVSFIRRLPGYVTLYNTTTPEFVQCHLFSEISVSWDGGHVVVQKDGRDVMHASDPYPVKVKAVAFGAIRTGNGDVAWKFPRHTGKSTVIITPSGGNDFTKWVTVSQTFIFFKLRAASNAIIRLCETPGVMGNGCYEVGIQHTAAGGGGLCTSFIREHSLADDGVTAEGCGWIGAEKSVAFWLSWKNNVVSLGFGSSVDYHAMLSWGALESANRHPVEAITMTTYRQDGYWEFSEVEDKVFELKTLAYDPPQADGPYYTWLRMSDNQLKFKLQGCPTAVLLLTETPGDMTGPRYEIEMGEHKSHAYKITRTAEKEILETFDTPNFLDCQHYKEYLLKWSAPYTDTMSIVLEEVMGENYMNIIDEYNQFKVHAISFATRATNLAYWMFNYHAAAVISFDTAGTKDSEQVLYKQTHLQYFLFKVKGKGPAHVVLQEHYHTDTVYEFIIGAENNQKTAVSIAGSGKQYDDITDTPNILSEIHFRQLWVQWSDFRVSIGYGILPGANPILSYPISDKASIQYVALTTSMGNNGTWEVTRYSPDTILSYMAGSMSSNPAVSYQLMNGQTGLVFSVWSCNGFSISLHPTKTEPANYKLTYVTRVLSIYRHNTRVHKVDLEDDLCGDDLESYWLGWANGVFHLTTGSEGGRRVIEWTDATPLPIHVMKIPDDGQVSKFALSRVLGMGVEVTQLRQPSGMLMHWMFNSLWYTLSGRSGIFFGVKCQMTASILFTRTPGVFTHDGYEVRLSNGNTTVHNRITGEVFVNASTPLIVNAYDFSYFWAEWTDGRLAMGRGGLFGIGQLFSYEMESGYDIVAASFDSTENVTWSFIQDTGNEFIVETKMDASFKPVWFAPKGEMFSFSVLSSQNAVIRLSVQPDYTKPNYFDLVFGAADNTGFMFYEKDVQRTFVESKGVLDRNDFRRFWLQLSAGRLQVGAGPAGESQFLNEPLGDAEISTISLGDDSASSASWKVPTDQELMARFHTPPTKEFNTHWVTVIGHDRAVFRVRGCDGARLLLLSVLGNHLMPATLIDIDDNGTTSITDTYGTKHMTFTPNLLSCHETRSFWVIWFSSGVRFGSGAMPWHNDIIGFDMQDMHSVVAMSFASGINVNKTTTATWDIYRLKGNVLYETTSSTENTQGVQVVPPDGKSFGLRGHVRTCGGATVRLFPLEGIEGSTLNIVYGSNRNTRSEVIRGRDSVASASTPYFMHQAIDQPFWVTWVDSTLTTGLGPGTQPLLSYNDPDNNDMSITAFSSSGSTCDAHWTIDLVAGDTLIVESGRQFVANTPTVSLLDVGHFDFRVKAKHAAHIALYVIPGNWRYLAYEIVIQMYLSGDTCLREGVGSTPDTCIHDSDLLDEDEFREFWITWDKFTLSFGKGWSPSDKSTELLSKTDNLMPPFALVSFASYTSTPAIWELVLSNRTASVSTTTTSSTSTNESPVTPISPVTSTSPQGSSTRASSTTTPNSSGGSSTTQQTTTPENGDDGSDSGDLAPGAIVGIVFGALLGAMLLGVLGVALFMRLRPGAGVSHFSNHIFSNQAYSDLDNYTSVDEIPLGTEAGKGSVDIAGDA